MSAGYYLLAVLLLATFGVMMAGVALMGIGGKSNLRYGNHLMVARVMLQGMSLLAIAVLFTMGKS